MKIPLIITLTAIMSLSLLQAQNTLTHLVPPAQAVAPGSPVQIDLVSLNPGEVEVRFETTPVHEGAVITGGRTWPVEPQATSPTPDVIFPGGFAVQSYTFNLPAAANGRVIVEFTRGTEVFRTVLNVDGVAPATTEADPPRTNLTVRQPAASALERTFAGRVSAHESIYFIYGPETKSPAAKFQISFKYRFLNFSRDSENKVPATLQFGFTQRSLWDIDAASSPFYDTSYMPELFFESLAPMPEDGSGGFTWLGYQAGYKHESNGRDGPISRSSNTLNLRVAMVFGQINSWHLLVMPEVLTYVSGSDNNADLRDYRGNAQLRLRLGKANGPMLLATGRLGRDTSRSSIKLDLSWPFRTRLLSFETYFLIQYFNGYGESLLAYDEKSEALRAGISLVR